MTFENDDFFKFIADNGFRQRVYKTSVGHITTDWTGPYNIRKDYRGYYFRQLYIELDFEFLTIYRGYKKIYRFIMTEKSPWSNSHPIKYLPIPEAILYFIVNKEIQPKPVKLSRYIPKNIRQIIFELFNHQCNFCGSTKRLQIDHIHPISKGGKSNKENLQILCQPCNLKKFNKLPHE